MTRVRSLVLAAGTLAAMAAGANAQYTFTPALLPAPSTASTTWQNITLDTSSVPAGVYSSYLVVYDYGRANTDGNQWSSESRFALSDTGAGGLYSANPTGATTTFIRTTAGATGSATNTNPVNNAFWYGNLTNNYTGGASNPLTFHYGQSFHNTYLNAQWSNVRVTLNPTVVTQPASVSGPAVPSSYLDLGVIDSGGTFNYNSGALTTSAASPVQWVRFVLSNPVSNPNALLDLDTENNLNSSGTLDSQLDLFVRSGSMLQYFGASGTDDDDGTGTRSQLSYGLTTSNVGGTRPYGVSATGRIAYNGRDGTLPAGEYFLAVGYFTQAAARSTTNVTTLNGTGDGVIITPTDLTTFTPGGTYGTTQLNVHYIPTPAGAALVGLGTLMVGRRRRQA